MVVNKTNKMIRMKILIVVFLISFIHHNVISQESKYNTKSLNLIDSYFENIINKGKLAGAITLLANKEDVRHFKAYGYSDIEDSIVMSTDLLIPIASMTKVITSIAVLQLDEKGIINIDEPIEKYIPEFKKVKVLSGPDSSLIEDLKVKPTIRDFLRHTSGVVYSGGKSYVEKQYRKVGFGKWNEPLDEFIRKLTEIPLAFQPNEKWSYGYSHDVLGYLVEKVTEEPLNQYCKTNIFKPLELYNTDFFVPKSKSVKFSNLYIYKRKELKLEDHRDSSIYNVIPTAISGGGGWWTSYGGVVTSVNDFFILTKALLNYGSYKRKRILKQETVKSFISNQIGSLDAYGNKYGLGVGVEISENNETKEIFWAGSPYNTYFWIDYENDIIGIMFTNTAPFGHLGMMDKFKEIAEKAMVN